MPLLLSLPIEPGLSFQRLRNGWPMPTSQWTHRRPRRKVHRARDLTEQAVAVCRFRRIHADFTGGIYMSRWLPVPPYQPGHSKRDAFYTPSLYPNVQAKLQSFGGTKRGRSLLLRTSRFGMKRAEHFKSTLPQLETPRVHVLPHPKQTPRETTRFRLISDRNPH